MVWDRNLDEDERSDRIKCRNNNGEETTYQWNHSEANLITIISKLTRPFTKLTMGNNLRAAIIVGMLSKVKLCH